MLSRLAPSLRSTLRASAQPSPALLLRSLATLPKIQQPSPSSSSSPSPTFASAFQRAAPFGARGVANQVSNQPGSQSVQHATLNIKEELGGAAGAVAKAVAGEPANKPESHGTDFASITKEGLLSVPRPVLLWGLAGTVPYGLSALTTAWTARHISELIAEGATNPNLALLDSVQSFQITYGAVILSFLGALHWGMEISKQGGQIGHKRLALGVAPLLYAWPTLYMADPTLALVAQWVGFLASWITDRWACNVGWTPIWYSQYRFYLTLVAGGSIIFSLISLNHFDVRSPAHKVHETHVKSIPPAAFKESILQDTGVAYSKDQSGASFGHLDKKASKSQEKKKEDEKLAEKQREKDIHQSDESKGVKEGSENTDKRPEEKGKN